MRDRSILIVITILSLAGLALASYSFLHNQYLASGEFCTIGATFDCDIVNRGPFSKIFGVPVSLIGIFGYLFLAAAGGYLIDHPEDRPMRAFFFLAVAGGLAFSFYLSGLEAFVLKTWCLLCLTSQLIIILIFAGTLRLALGGRK